jgi:hypothetical protein
MGMNASLFNLLIWSGLIILSVSWAFFRKPDVKFWQFSPIWRQKEYLTPIGMFITLLGWAIILIATGSIPRPLGRMLAASKRIEERS